jgi:hypothetical protein
MSPDRWRRVEELYHSALERGDSERAEYLAVACDGDEELHREVASLLETEYSPRPILDGEAMVVTAAPKLEVGTQLGPYRIEGLLGEGGMGVVYRATDSRLGRTVAVKVLQNGAGADPQARERFTREARSISALSHPNICSLFDVGEHDGIGYLVLEYVEGETLAARLKKGPLAIDQVVRYGGQIAGALAAAHARGMVHRDLKPGNVVLTSSGAKLLDFGLAKLAGPARPDEDPLTWKRVVVGTPGYMSPEQTEGRDCDARSDIYVLGLVLYEMAAGEKPTIHRAAAIESRRPALSRQGSGRSMAFSGRREACARNDLRQRYRDTGNAIQVAAVDRRGRNGFCHSTGSRVMDAPRHFAGHGRRTPDGEPAAGHHSGSAVSISPCRHFTGREEAGDHRRATGERDFALVARSRLSGTSPAGSKPFRGVAVLVARQ